jgi:hypothetical protein
MRWKSEDFARPDWSRRVNKALEKVNVERDSSSTLIDSVETDLLTLNDLLTRTKQTLDTHSGANISGRRNSLYR